MLKSCGHLSNNYLNVFCVKSIDRNEYLKCDYNCDRLGLDPKHMFWALIQWTNECKTRTKCGLTFYKSVFTESHYNCHRLRWDPNHKHFYKSWKSANHSLFAIFWSQIFGAKLIVRNIHSIECICFVTTFVPAFCL